MKIAWPMPPNRHSGFNPGPGPGSSAGLHWRDRRQVQRPSRDFGNGPPPAGPAGFTLIELLLALSLFVMIVGVVFAAFSGVMKGVEQGRRNLEVHRLGRAILLRMAQEVRAAMHDAAYAGFAHGENARAGDYARDRLTFVTVPYQLEAAPGSDVCEVAYYVGANAQGTAGLYREQDCTPDGEPLNGDTVALTDAAVGLDVTYFDRNDTYDKWPDSAAGPLPCLVRLTLTLRDEQEVERAFITTVSLPMSKGCRDVPGNG